MSLFSWYNSADQLSGFVFYLSIVGAVVEVGVAIGAFIDLRNENLEKAKEKQLERYIAVMAVIAATLGFTCIFLSQRASGLQEVVHKEELRTYDERYTSQSNRLFQSNAKVLELETKFGPRRIEGERRRTLVNTLVTIRKSRISVAFSHGNLECRDFANDLATAFQVAGFPITEFSPSVEAIVEAEVMVFHNPTNSVQLILKALDSVGIKAKGYATKDSALIGIFVAPKK